MKHCYATAFVTLFFSALTFAQKPDSTTQFKCDFEKVDIKHEWVFEGETKVESMTGSSDRFSFIITDPVLRHCLLSARLMEYKDGQLVKEDILFARQPVYRNAQYEIFEDSSFVFYFYKRPAKDNRAAWGFRTPSSLKVETVEMGDPESYVVTLVDPLLGKLPVGKPFVWLVITAPDATRNFPFFIEKNKGKVRAYDWNKTYGLKHTFLIELNIERSNEPRPEQKKATTEIS